MAEIQLTQTQFNGGISPDSKSGLPNAARFTRHLDIFSDTDSVRLNPKPIKDSASTVVDLVKYMVDAYPYETARYAVGDTGKIYKITSNTWAVDRTVSTNNAAGQGAAVLEDWFFYANGNSLGRKGILSAGSAAYNDDFVNTNGTGTGDLSFDNRDAAGGNTYTLPSSITEDDANSFTFTAAHDPIKYLQLYVSANGTGNWLFTIHDEDNNLVMNTVESDFTNPGGTGYFNFTFGDQLRLKIGKIYHIHITNAAGTAIVRSGTSSDLSDADMAGFFAPLVNNSHYHPIITHTDGTKGIIAIANGQYIATYDLTTFLPNKITIEPGYNIRGWVRENEYIVAYAWKGTTVEDFDEGKMFYWDGIQPYYNFSKPIPDGTPNTMVSSKNRIFSVLGSKGDMALGTEPFRALQSAPKLTPGYNVEVMPGAATTWQRRVHLGFSNSNDPNAGAYNFSTGADSPGIEQGVYEFGSRSDRAISVQSVSTEIINFAYSPSTAIANPTAFKIGCVEAFGEDMYIGIKDGSSYYVDRVNKGNAKVANASYESLIIDLGMNGKSIASMPQKSKRAVKLIATFEGLAAGCAVTLKHKINRASDWTLGTPASTDGAVLAELDFDEGSITSRYREIEIGYDLASTDGNDIIITGFIFVFDPLTDEVNYS